MKHTMNSQKAEDMTEVDFLDLVNKICKVDYKTEYQHTQAVLLFEQISEHPDGSDLIFYPKPGVDSSPEGIVKTVINWRIDNGKPSFKKEN